MGHIGNTACNFTFPAPSTWVVMMSRIYRMYVVIAVVAEPAILPTSAQEHHDNKANFHGDYVTCFDFHCFFIYSHLLLVPSDWIANKWLCAENKVCSFFFSRNLVVIVIWRSYVCSFNNTIAAFYCFNIEIS